jgi:hypothetical protein
MFKQISTLKKITFSLGIMLAATTVFSQEERPELITHMPDASEAPTKVPKGSLQIQTGAFYTYFANTINEKSNIGAQWEADNQEAAYIYTMAHGYLITNKLGCYAEVYGDFPEDNRANHCCDAGLIFLAMPNLEFDATLGTGIIQGQDLRLSAGLSHRILK